MSESRPNRVRVLLVDDHPVVRSGLRYMLEQGNRLVVVGEAESGRDAVRLAQELRPDVIFMDISMPEMNGLEATRQIKEGCPMARILIVSMHTDDEYVLAALEAGADGYLLKQCHPQELRAGVLQVCAGERVIHPSLVRALINRAVHRPAAPAHEALSEREREVLQMLAEGETSKGIAVALGLKPKTVENHRARILDKLGVANSAAAVRVALAEGLVAGSANSPKHLGFGNASPA